mgnify:CR=1 FL=1
MFKISKKIITSGATGTALEMYDYLIWGLFSAFLSREFLPPRKHNESFVELFEKRIHQ